MNLTERVAALREQLKREGWLDWDGNLRSHAPDDVRAVYDSIVAFER